MNSNEPTTITFLPRKPTGLPSGDYEIDARLCTDDWPELGKTAPTKTREFSVQGPRFTVDPSLILHRYPEDGATGNFESTLAHITFSRPTLPWERVVNSGGNADRPWLALLLLEDDEFDHDPNPSSEPNPLWARLYDAQLVSRDGKSYDPIPKFLPTSVKAPNGTLPPLRVERGDADSAGAPPKCRLLFLPSKTYHRVMPANYDEELDLTAHVRRIPGATTPSIQSTIISRQLPAPPTPDQKSKDGAPGPTGRLTRAFLVSLEGLYGNEGKKLEVPDVPQELADAKTGQLPPAEKPGHLLIVLASWQFSCLGPEHDFASRVRKMDCGPLARPGVDSGNDAVTRRIGAGYLPLEYNGRQGNRDVAWFRGPAIPCQESSQTTWPENAKSSDAYLRVVEPGSVTDTSLAAAYELGRLTILADRNASARLVAAKHRLARGNAASLASAQKRQRISVDSPPPSYPPDLVDWFGNLRALRSVPFAYLVPDETMLPLNSIRYFQLDREWLSAMARGAWSVGYVCGLGSKSNLPPELDFNGTVSGLLVRSSVLREWPHMKVSAFQAKNQALPCIRNEALTPDLWLLLFDGPMVSWSLRLPHEHPHFGFSKDDEGWFKDLGPSRFALTHESNDNPTLKAPISQDAIVERTVNLTQLRNMISATLYPKTIERFPDGTTVTRTKLFAPASFALIMMEQSHSITFNITPSSEPTQ